MRHKCQAYDGQRRAPCVKLAEVEIVFKPLGPRARGAVVTDRYCWRHFYSTWTKDAKFYADSHQAGSTKIPRPAKWEPKVQPGAGHAK